MGKHSKNSRHRRIVVAALAVGVVGVPSAALACVDWQGDAGHQAHVTANRTAARSWGSDPDWYRRWSADGGSRPSWSASATPSATAGPERTHVPRPRHTTAAPSTHTAGATPRPSATATTDAPQAATPSALAGAPASSTPTPTATASSTAARILELVNAERAKVGCSALTLNSTLDKVAQAHSADMAEHQNMSHTGSDGSDPGERITAGGYAWSSYGENVAYGYSTPEQVMEGWMSSPGHKENILNCDFKELGVGLAQPGSYWTQDFGTAR
ncbi:CAP domain-containing protein [Streptomyces sp. NPDC048664]|uniref:CAP domain-containing protein n=1 Tax=Streptomyces sp. NPDC048664 TaxID=3154505 RepID=UPI00342ACA34